MNKEQKIEEILKSAKAILPVEANAYLHTRIHAKLPKELPVQKISPGWVYAISAGLLLLLFLNISTWRNTTKNQQKEHMEQLAQEFSWTGNNKYSLNY